MTKQATLPFKALNKFISGFENAIHTAEFEAFALFASNLLSQIGHTFDTPYVQETWSPLLTKAWEAFKTSKAQKPVFLTQEITEALGVFPKSVLLLSAPAHPLGPPLLCNLFEALERPLTTFLSASLKAQRTHDGHLKTLQPLEKDTAPGNAEDFYVLILDDLLEPSAALEIQHKIKAFLDTLAKLRISSAHAQKAFEDLTQNADAVDPFFLTLFRQQRFIPLGYHGATQNEGVDFFKALGVQPPRAADKNPKPLYAKHLFKTDFSTTQVIDQMTFFEAPVGTKQLPHTFFGYSVHTLLAREAQAFLQPKLRQLEQYVATHYGWPPTSKIRSCFDGLPLFVAQNLTTKHLASLVLSLLTHDTAGKLALYDIRDSPLKLLHIPIPEATGSQALSSLTKALNQGFGSTCVALDVQRYRTHTSFYFLCPLAKTDTKKAQETAEGLIRDAVFSWTLRFQKALKNRLGGTKGAQFYQNYAINIPKNYQTYALPLEAADDLLVFQKGLGDCQFKCQFSHQKNQTLLKIYHPKTSLPLSRLVPILSHMGLQVDTEISFCLPKTPQYAQSFIHFVYLSQVIDAAHFGALEKRLEETFEAIFYQEAESDDFHKLIVSAGLTWQECRLLRAYAKYLKQINVPYSDTYIQETFSKHVPIVQQLIQLFHDRLRPVSSAALCPQDQTCPKEHPQLLKQISDIPHHDDEHVLRCFFNLITATVRTNFYQTTNAQSKSYLSLKFDCRHIEGLPLPKPLFEIFVYASFMEGVHLRSGLVARGGLRWSDRKEDYRNEILGLMKTQVIKNAIIVPVGAKGGFISKELVGAPTPPDAYSVFIKGLLDVTDNYLQKKIIAPRDVASCDQDDPYLVVAADKGTATRSNDANALARTYHFWLDDAFASGGTHGYDHKKMGITAKGAWKSVEHHFQKNGLSLNKPFTVIGIGDMSGDVFGNGMLLSKKIQLRAAFDHRHIFLDPNPDPATSYKERKRLFQKERSSWKDYDTTLISKGGGVFERNARTITLSKEIQAWLGLSADKVTPQKLMQAILKAPADLLWFGGIGTFIKGHLESNLSIADRANDNIRVNGQDVKARIIAEGANLGITEKGRVEFALKGGILNTDAIDNAAGVTCSDYEVNIKILYAQLMQEKKLTHKERNKMLSEMEEAVAELVLAHNVAQNETIYRAHALRQSLFEEHCRLMRVLEKEDLLERSLNGFPSEDELQERRHTKTGFTRPEIATLLGYAKISLKAALSNASFLSEKPFEALLSLYFPPQLNKRFHKRTPQHPLARDIVNTSLVNLLLNHLGPSFVHEINALTKASYQNIVKAVCVAQMLCTQTLFTPQETDRSNAHHALLENNKTIKRLAIWFLRHEDLSQPFENITAMYQKGFQELQSTKNAAQTPHQEANDNLPSPEEALFFAPDMIQVQKCTKKQLHTIAQLYHMLGKKLGIHWLRHNAEHFYTATYWQQKALEDLKEQVFFIQQQLTLYVMTNFKAKNTADLLLALEEKVQGALQDYTNLLTALQSAPKHDMSVVVVLTQELQRLYEKVAGMCVKTVAFT
ncbi:MAG: NAD-glutamate dehydrogenase domain-containing protein [Holosporaceae bacterium]